ncbi:unnamed protein product [Ostreobium quekettii]|uniref:PsbP C-terminal domain-containing protein n=1 Tax=Ostreobium quekettii TaxID=121088 RepID=A0A8S1IQK9_9CHLO|nr:unnamed protein product [Ostreobium quekettii]|eukprot:evm.model.scf_114.5 EVM.evm.TU.scf_114.5   scf_114:105404-109457(+)
MSFAPCAHSSHAACGGRRAVLVGKAPGHSGACGQAEAVRNGAGAVQDVVEVSRRALMIAAPVAGVGLLGAADGAQGKTVEAAEVGEYLPPSNIDGFVKFVPDAQKTPAIRAGTVDPKNPYSFSLPTTWREGKVANILSGNYCQPRCDEPWTEVIFNDASEGRVAVLVTPLFRLTSKREAKMEEVGSTKGVLQSIGPYITGTVLDEEDLVSAESKKQDDGRTYYMYEVNTPYGTFGTHAVASCTTKGDLALLLVATANDKQWAKSQSNLRKIASSFRA